MSSNLRSSLSLSSLCLCRCKVETGWYLCLKDAYLQVPIYPDSCKFLRFIAFDRVYKFKALVFWSLHCPSSLHEGHGSGVDFSPLCRNQDSSVSGRLVDPGSLPCFSSPSYGHCSSIVSGLWNRGQLGEIQSSSFPANCLSGCDTGFIVFQGFSPSAESREVSINRQRISVLHHSASVILERAYGSLVISDSSCSRRPPPHAVSPASAPSLMGSGRRPNPSSVGRLLPAGSGVVAGAVSPGVGYLSCSGITFWSDSSDVGWGALGLWFLGESNLSINARELLAVERGLLHSCHLLSGSTVGVFVDNSMAVAYLHKQGGNGSPVLNSIAQWILYSTDSLENVVAPQFVMGKNNVLADSLSRPNQVQGSEWTLRWEVFQELCKKWPVMIDLFATSLNHRCSLCFSPLHDPRALGTDALLQDWGSFQVYAFPPWSLIPLVLKKLCFSFGVLMTGGSLVASVSVVF